MGREEVIVNKLIILTLIFILSMVMIAGITGKIPVYHAVWEFMRIMLAFGMGYAFAKWEDKHE